MLKLEVSVGFDNAITGPCKVSDLFGFCPVIKPGPLLERGLDLKEKIDQPFDKLKQLSFPHQKKNNGVGVNFTIVYLMSVVSV